MLLDQAVQAANATKHLLALGNDVNLPCAPNRHNTLHCCRAVRSEAG